MTASARNRGYTRGMEDSIFTKIIKGEVPGEMIFQDDQCAVLLTVAPNSPGHMMVIPKTQIDHLWDLEDELYHHLMSVAKQMATRLRAAYTYERIGLIVEGFGVPHAHIHVFGYEKPLEPTIEDVQKIKREKGDFFATPEELQQAADKLRAV